MYNWEQIVKANSLIKTTKVKEKDYAEVNQRIKAFRSVCPGGAIITDMLSNVDGVCVFQASVYDEENHLLGTGTAYEKETSSFINKTSYIENCETSAVGRALGMCGFGIDTSVASAEEVQNAIQNQGEHPKQEQPKQEQPKQERPPLSPRKQLIARLNQLGIDVNAYAAANNLNGKTEPEVFLKLLKELENA